MTNENDLIKVLLVDDHEVVRSGLITFLKAVSGLQLAGEAANGRQAVEICAEDPPDVVLMDIKMPEMDGVQAAKEITSQNPKIRIIMLTSFKDMHMVKAALDAGAVGYLQKDVTIQELGDAIKKAYHGETILSSDAAKALVEISLHPEFFGQQLTDRELDVLKGMAAGLTNPEIAEKLVISKTTVKTHVKNIFNKLDVSNRTEAVTLAIKNKIIPEP